MDPTMVSTQTLIRQTKELRLFIENVNVIKLIKYTSLIPSGWDRITLISINLLCVFVYITQHIRRQFQTLEYTCRHIKFCVLKEQNII